MATLDDAAEALGRAKGVNKGLDAMVSMLMSGQGQPSGESLGELLWALHDQMETHLDVIGQALND